MKKRDVFPPAVGGNTRRTRREKVRGWVSSGISSLTGLVGSDLPIITQNEGT